MAGAASLAYILGVSASPPKFVRPCIPTTAKVIPRGEAWLHEPKLDGYLPAPVVRDGPAIRLYSRRAHDRTKRLALLAEALAGIRCRSGVIDCELVFPAGRPDFYRLQSAHGAGARHGRVEVAWCCRPAEAPRRHSRRHCGFG
jgi:ATP-dependent DNA ligase